MSRMPPEGAHFLGQTVHLVSRLRDHIERLDGGAAYAADDLAVVLRAFLHPKPGNDMLRRFEAFAGRSPSPIMVSQPPASDALFSVGSIPTREHTEVDGARPLALDEWARQPVAYIKDKHQQTTYTWSTFLNTYANKWGGAHLDRAVPAHLQVIDMYAAGSFNLSGYLLRTAAVAVWTASQELLRAVTAVALLPEHVDSERGIITGSGGVSTVPPDRLSHGELQWLTYTGDSTSFRLYSDGPCRIRITRGGPHTAELVLQPEGDSRAPASVNEVRSPMVVPEDPAQFTLGRMMSVSGFVTAPPRSPQTRE